MTDSKAIGVIPARYGSTRFPGKMLANILGKSLLQRTYENARQASSLKEIIIATDDERIYTHAKDFGGNVVMTSPLHLTGTDRVAEVVKTYLKETEMIVNIQGDEPCLDPSVIDTLVKDLTCHPDAVLTTPVVPIMNEQDIFASSVVKCVFTPAKRALYFSRSPIPYLQKERFHKGIYYRHLGVYCFRKAFLLEYAQLPKTPLQQLEDLEQLKILEHGFPIYVSLVQDDGIGVDTLEDLKRIEDKLCKENTSLSQAELSLL